MAARDEFIVGVAPINAANLNRASDKLKGNHIFCHISTLEPNKRF